MKTVINMCGQCKEEIKSAVLALRQQKNYNKVAVIIDVDPI